MADESTPVTSPGEPGTPPDPSSKLAAIEARLGGSADATAEGQESTVQKQGENLLTGDVTVDWGGGTRRTVPIEQLVKAAQRADEIEQRSKAVQEQLQEMGALSALGSAIEEMDDLQRDQLRKIFSNPTLLTEMANGKPTPRSREDYESEMDDLLAGKKTPPVQDSRIDELARSVQELRQFAEASLAKEKSQGLAQRVASSMKTYPVFEENPDALRLTMKSIINEHTLNPNASLESIVASHAADLHKLVIASRNGVVVQATGSSPSPTPTPVNAEGWKPTGDDLMNKSILKKVLSDMGHR